MANDIERPPHDSASCQARLKAEFSDSRMNAANRKHKDVKNAPNKLLEVLAACMVLRSQM